MRFLIQIPQLIYAGAEKVLVNFANELVERGHEVEILESYDRGYLKPQFDSRVIFNCICSDQYSQKYYASLSDVRNTKNIKQKIIKATKLIFSKIVGYRRFAEKLMAKYYKDKWYDVAINYLEIESPDFLLKSVHAKKYIQWYHTDVSNASVAKETDKLISSYEKMDAIVCVSEFAKKKFVERYPSLSEKTYVIYNFFDEQNILEKAKVPFYYRHAKEDIPVLLSVGRLTPQKQYLRFLDVLARLRDEGFEFQWYVLGDGQDRDKILAKINELDLVNRVYMEGLSDNPYKYMKHCNLFVLPSGWEGFPTVTIEAKILNCAILATDVSGIREQLIHGKTGWIVDNDEIAIYEGLKYLLEHTTVVENLKMDIDMNGIYSNSEKYENIMKLCQ